MVHPVNEHPFLSLPFVLKAIWFEIFHVCLLKNLLKTNLMTNFSTNCSWDFFCTENQLKISISCMVASDFQMLHPGFIPFKPKFFNERFYPLFFETCCCYLLIDLSESRFFNCCSMALCRLLSDFRTPWTAQFLCWTFLENLFIYFIL